MIPLLFAIALLVGEWTMVPVCAALAVWIRNDCSGWSWSTGTAVLGGFNGLIGVAIHRLVVEEVRENWREWRAPHRHDEAIE